MEANGPTGFPAFTPPTEAGIPAFTPPTKADVTGITLPAGTYTLSLEGALEDAAATGDIDITGLDRVFHILAKSTANISGLTVRNADISGLTVRDALGGGINNLGTLTMANVIVSGNSSVRGGGGIYNGPCGSCLASGVRISMALTDSTVSGNSTGGNVGGGIYNAGTLTVTDSAVSGNSAGTGGGIENARTLTLTGSTVSGNTAGSQAPAASTPTAR